MQFQFRQEMHLVIHICICDYPFHHVVIVFLHQKSQRVQGAPGGGDVSRTAQYFMETSVHPIVGTDRAGRISYCGIVDGLAGGCILVPVHCTLGIECKLQVVIQE